MFVWIAALASNIIAFFATVVTKKAAVATTGISAGIALMLSLAAAINILVAGIVAALPSWAQSGAMFIPPNAGLCLSAVLTAMGSKWAYNFAQKSIDRVIQA